MSFLVMTSPAPGWYPDPVGQDAYRWWDGDTWTEGTHEALVDVVGSVESVAPLMSDTAYEPRAPIQLFADPEPEPAAAPFVAEPATAPFVSAPATASTAPVRRTVSPAKTRWSSLLVAFPFIYPVALGMIVALGYAGGAASSTTTLVVIGGIAAVGLLTPAWIFADYDRRELIARGYEPAPSVAWMLLLPPFAYLLARRRVVGPSY
ncbi:hypothetical protein BH09ACT4_BH09ACT4_08490 [soil metagenome]